MEHPGLVFITKVMKVQVATLTFTSHSPQGTGIPPGTPDAQPAQDDSLMEVGAYPGAPSWAALAVSLR